MPNEIFCLGLDSKEIATYAYLLGRSDRETYQCHFSYRTIGKAVKTCENTARKYVFSPKEKDLIHTEPTTITTKDGRIRNGSLRYTIRPIQEALDIFYQRQSHEPRKSRENTTKETAGTVQQTKSHQRNGRGKRMIISLANLIVDHDSMTVAQRTRDTVLYIQNK